MKALNTTDARFATMRMIRENFMQPVPGAIVTTLTFMRSNQEYQVVHASQITALTTEKPRHLSLDSKGMFTEVQLVALDEITAASGYKDLRWATASSLSRFATKVQQGQTSHTIPGWSAQHPVAHVYNCEQLVKSDPLSPIA
jgi:hypothetical protein